MKLLRYGPKGQERPGLLDQNGQVRDLSGHGVQLHGEGVSPEALQRIAALTPEDLPLVETPGRIGSCLSSVPNFYCIGLNYTLHAAESGADIPAEPLVFSKASSALSGPEDGITLPRGSSKTDWEVELGVVIGRAAHYVSEDTALEHVAGYCTINDVSERNFQNNRGGQWIKGKSAPGFGPIGPWLVTADDVPDPQALGLQLALNGQVVQESSTSDMIFTVAQIISYMSQMMQLLPGDVISTGTPSGVGMGMKPPRFLVPGDHLTLSVEGLGSQSHEVRAAD